jgi:hypothetical protein
VERFLKREAVPSITVESLSLEVILKMAPSTVKIPRSDIPGLDKISDKAPGLINVNDLAQSAWEFLSESKIGMAIGRFVEKLKAGDLKTVVIVGTTIVVGAMVAYRFLLDDDDDKDKKKDTKEEEETDPLKDFTVEQLVSSSHVTV